ncbi:MAG: hypothetical protein RDV48_27605 [Candidatus Eremiobacteraeota bacterium]|nr:hypothetical protein [Candidatus Eremiobacteraeota bacterium]
MKSIALFMLAVCVLLLPASSQIPAQESLSGTMVAQKAGLSLDEFRKLWDAEGKSPEGSVRCLLIAVLETVKEQNPDGLKMWGMALPKDTLDGSGEPGRGHVSFILTQFGRQVQGTGFRGGIAASYLGGSPHNGYAYSYSATPVVTERRQGSSPDEVTLFVRSGGKDNPSPVTLKKNKDGYWKIFNYSSLYTGVKPIDTRDF